MDTPQVVETVTEVLAEATPETPVEATPAPVEDQRAKDAQESFRELRQQRDQERSARERLERENYDMKMWVEQQRAQAQQKASELPDEGIAEGRHINEVRKNQAQLQKEVQQERQARQQLQLKLDYPDWDKVLTKDNLIRLAEKYPAVARTIQSNPDEYSAGVTAYEMIKAKNIYQEEGYMAEKERVQQNAAKPRASASVSPQRSDSPLSKVGETQDPYILTKEMREANERWLVDKRKNRGQR